MDTLRAYERLISSGVGDKPARCFVEILWSASRGEFDYEMAQAKLVDSGLMHTQALLLVRGVEDAARAAGAIAGIPRWARDSCRQRTFLKELQRR